MTLLVPHASPSGPLGAPLAIQSLGYTLTAPLEMVLLAAGHLPGIYEARFWMNVRATSPSVINRVFTYSAPNVGLSTTISNSSGALNALGSPLTPGSQYQTGSSLISDGRLPIKVLASPVLSGSPLVDLYGTALLFNRILS